jgi:hypothetical protein
MPKTMKRENKLAKPGNKQIAEKNAVEPRRNIKKSSNALRSFVFSPAFNVVALVTLLVLVFTGMRLFSARRNHAQVAFVEQPGFNQPETVRGENSRYSAPEIFHGEVYETSIRLRETGALGMAISLCVFAEFSEKKNIPANLETVLRAAAARNLLPPEMTFENGAILSPSSVFFVRYRSEPLAFEILSSPKQAAAKSPALMLRFPLASLDKRTITYFQSPATNHFEMPEPFAPIDRIVAAGWTLEQWRGELLPRDANAVQTLAEEKRLLSETANR